MSDSILLLFTSQMPLATPASNRELLNELPADVKELEFECNLCGDFVHYLMARHCYNCFEECRSEAFSICLHCWITEGDYCPTHKARPIPSNILALLPSVMTWIDVDWHKRGDGILDNKQMAVMMMLYRHEHEKYETQHVIPFPPKNLPATWFTEHNS